MNYGQQCVCARFLDGLHLHLAQVCVHTGPYSSLCTVYYNNFSSLHTFVYHAQVFIQYYTKCRYIKAQCSSFLTVLNQSQVCEHQSASCSSLCSTLLKFVNIVASCSSLCTLKHYAKVCEHLCIMLKFMKITVSYSSLCIIQHHSQVCVQYCTILYS